MFDPSNLDTRAKRKSVQDGEWRFSAQLVRVDDGAEVVLEESTVPLRITDARLNSEPFDTGWHIMLWANDMVDARARREERQKKARKK